jgi:hypothetical protein
MRVAPGGRAIDLIPSSEILKEILKWERGVTYEWTLDAKGKPCEIGLRQARDGEPTLELRQYAIGCGFRIPCPNGMKAKEARRFVNEMSRRSPAEPAK